MATDKNIAGAESLGADINKVKKDGVDNTTGVSSTKLPELKLDMKDADIVKLTNQWEEEWNDSPKKQEWVRQVEENEKYWLGKQFDMPKAEKSRANVDNLIFESLETYLPQVTRRNPEPLAKLRSGEEENEENTAYLTHVKDALADIADEIKLRLKLKRAARHWSIYHIGVAKPGWDLDRDIPIVRIVRPRKMILDPDALTDEDGYTGNRAGEYRKMGGGTLLKIIESTQEAPKEDDKEKVDKEGIKQLKEDIKDKEGTEVKFIEWWTPEYMCWKYKEYILLKIKNPHWNYDREEEPTGENIAEEGVEVDDYGNTSTREVKVEGVNHLPVPKIPFIFLTIFNLGDQPMDNTGLITQNLANQDRLNKRNRQIDQNADNSNNGLVVSIERSGLTQSQAKTVSQALRKGGVITIPSGDPQAAIYRPTAPNLPADIFNDRNDTRERMRDIFGTRGSSAAGIGNETTVRGKIIARGLDTDRIGGGVSEYLEQFADDIYNWLYQLLLVYDDRFQFVGDKKPPRLVISVKEGSLLPKDSTTLANQAIELATAGKMALLDMFERLEYPNPEKLAANVWLEANAPELLYSDDPRIAQALQMKAQAAAMAGQNDANAEAAKKPPPTPAEPTAPDLPATPDEASLLSQEPIEPLGP